MQVVKPSMEILTPINREEILRGIEVAGRTCYKSEDKITEGSASKFVQMIVARGHLSVIEHKSLSVRFVCDRGVSHEMVRHRLSSFSQESTRYCNYGNNEHLKFIKPCFLNIEEEVYDESDIREPYVNTKAIVWVKAMLDAERSYLEMVNLGSSPQEARSVLPNSLKTEIVVTANLRQWKEILRQRTAKAAHPQIQEVMIPLLDELHKSLPEIF